MNLWLMSDTVMLHTAMTNQFKLVRISRVSYKDDLLLGFWVGEFDKGLMSCEGKSRTLVLQQELHDHLLVIVRFKHIGCLTWVLQPINQIRLILNMITWLQLTFKMLSYPFWRVLNFTNNMSSEWLFKTTPDTIFKVTVSLFIKLSLSEHFILSIFCCRSKLFFFYMN